MLAACRAPAPAPAALGPAAPAGASLEAAERAAIARALETHQGNRTRAAEALGIHRSTLRRKLAELGLDWRRR
jgi:DNA-binding NtrC family response regulator